MFIADLHLQVSEPATVKLARQFLQNVAPRSPQLFILGDLVEYWIGDDADDGSLNPVFDELQTLSTSGTAITLMHGNRDFLLGSGFADRIGANLITDDHYLLNTGEHSLLLMHGDTLCTDDHAYQTMRSTIRAATWQQAFLAKSVDERRAFADDLRQKSQNLSAQKQQDIMDVNQQAVLDVMQLHGVNTLIHGHTHKPAHHTLSREEINGDSRHDTHNASRFVLGDWHPDQAVYALLENQQVRLETFTA